MIEVNENLIKEVEVTALMKILKETGINGVLEFSDCIVLNHLIERGIIGHDRNSIITSLRENTTMSSSSIMELHNRYERLKTTLPSYSKKLNEKLDKINAMYESVIPFTWVGSRMVGFVKEGMKHIIYDGAGNHLIKLGEISEDYGVLWNTHWVIQPGVNQYVSKSVKQLKERFIC
jgi:hypothetical protein